MLNIADHVKLHIMYSESKLDRRNSLKYSTEELIQCFERIQKWKVSEDAYFMRHRLQEELIENEEMAKYVAHFRAEGVSALLIEKAIRVADNRRYKLTDYPVETIGAIISATVRAPETQYLILEFFPYETLSKTVLNILGENLYLLNDDEILDFPKLDDTAKRLFLQPYLAHSNAIPYGYALQTAQLLQKNETLQRLLMFFYKKEIDVSFSPQSFESLSDNTEQIFIMIQKVYQNLKISRDYQMSKFMRFWSENGCKFSELKRAVKKLEALSEDLLVNVFDTKSAYASLLYNEIILTNPMGKTEPWQDKIITYAVLNGKKRFLKLIEETGETFWRISNDSILFKENFYQDYFNLNSLTKEDLHNCNDIYTYSSYLEHLKPRCYTFQEIKALSKQPKIVWKLYSMLTCTKVDQRLLVLREIRKKNLRSIWLSDEEIESLAKLLSIKPLSRWRDQEFGHIHIKPENMIRLLISYDKIAKFMPDVHDEEEAMFLAWNANMVAGCENMEDIRSNIGKFDSDFADFKDRFNLTEEFLSLHTDTVLSFIRKGGSHLALTYFNNIRSFRKEAFKRIVKAELMGQLSEVKYHEGDLEQEIDYPVNHKLDSLWKTNRDMRHGALALKECDDFYSTMNIGTMPTRTCLSYIDGQYNECLLSLFDSNKKILYVRQDNLIIGRAIIRLTKGSFKSEVREHRRNHESYDQKLPTLSFVDLVRNSETDEQLILFLERPYIAHANPEEKQNVVNMLISFAEQKAAELGCLLVISFDYHKYILNAYTSTVLSLYISKSKAGCQYLDSLSGKATIDKEGSYQSNTFLVKESDLKS